MFVFDGPVRDAVHRLKYGGEYARAAWAGEHLAPTLCRLGWRADLLLPVPLHPIRLRQRGYNQSAKLAAALGKRLDVTVRDALVRERNTRPQVDLSAVERRRNVDGAFNARERLDGRHVVLIDDVMTTGATLLDCARACRAAGAADVRALTVAVQPAS